MPCNVPEGLTARNLIIEVGCPRSVGEMKYTAALAIAHGIFFVISELDCDPFYHGFGSKCETPKLFFAIWKRCVTSFNGENVMLKFYLTEGSHPLPIGSDFVSHSILMGWGNNFVMSSALGLAKAMRHFQRTSWVMRTIAAHI